jgi:pyruvate ferredoxin oxidoreductase beta subunit
VRIAKLAVETGVWALKESIHGEVTHSVIPRTRRPIEEYLQIQGRFEHLFKPKRQEKIIQELQKRVDHYWRNVTK